MIHLQLLFLLSPLAGATDMSLRVQTLRANYRPGEAIQFQIEASADHYLYIFNLDEVSGKLLLAEPGEPGDERFHSGAIAYTVPEGNTEFVGTDPGMEHFLFVACTTRIPLAELSTGTYLDLIDLPLAQTLTLIERHRAVCVELDVFIN